MTELTLCLARQCMESVFFKHIHNNRTFPWSSTFGFNENKNESSQLRSRDKKKWVGVGSTHFCFTVSVLNALVRKIPLTELEFSLVMSQNRVRVPIWGNHSSVRGLQFFFCEAYAHYCNLPKKAAYPLDTCKGCIVSSFSLLNLFPHLREGQLVTKQRLWQTWTSKSRAEVFGIGKYPCKI